MKKNATVEYWNIDFEEDTARFSIEDDDENASIIVDVVLNPDLERHTCSVKRVIDCWYLADEDEKIERTRISDSEIKSIDKILQEEYSKYLGE